MGLEEEEVKGNKKDTGVRFLLGGKNPSDVCRNVDVLRS